MKLQDASRKEAIRISKGVLILDGVMIAALFLLSQFGLGKFDIVKVLLGTALGSVISIGNFIILCLTIQSALEIENKRKMKARFQTSYNIRLFIQAAWIVAAFLLRSKVHFIAASLPVFFPNVWLIYLQINGKLNTAPLSPAQTATPDPAEVTVADATQE
ncbi:MAG: ATP synthase subunit I [Oscillospiraceae bacterium]|nr:ATP synthase subunit I [Oscillospiraceae bacterium]